MKNRESSQSKSTSKHEFYDEFSMIEKKKKPKYSITFKKGSPERSLIVNFIKSLKPAPKQTHCSKCKEVCCSISFIKSLFPILSWIPQYNFQWLKRDLIAGLTVAILLVPQSLAYATLAGLPPEYGLYASVVPLLIYSIWSTSTSVAIGPTAPTAIMIASAVEGIMSKMDITEADAEYFETYQSVTMTLTFVCGLILIIFGLIRAGFIINF